MMRVSIERLRVWLLVGAALLVVVIAGFLEYAHLEAHRFLKNLPARLGADITRESNGFTWSQSSRGKTVYTIHAAKMLQRKDGKTTLHDVGIVLYGQKGDRADRIYGKEFEYDQKNGVIRAIGEVHLDLQAPAPTDARGRAAYASGRDASGRDTSGLGPAEGDAHGASDVDDERMVHVKTSGLVFMQSLGVASTDQEIEFQYHGMTGQAKGADYNSDTGVTVLQRDVRVSGLRDGEPALLTAAHAEMDRSKEELVLRRARYFAGAERAGGGRTVTAEEATIHLRADGSIDHAVAHGGVSLEQGGGVLRGQDADVTVSEESRPEIAHMGGGLTYASTTDTSKMGLREVEGRAGHGTMRFDAQGRAETALMEQGAEVHLRERGAAALPWSERTISGDRLEMRFATAGRRQWMRDGTVTGAGRMLLVDRSPGRAPGKGAAQRESSTEVRGDVLTAEMQWDGRAARLAHVTGQGRTSVERHDVTGAEDTSRGNTLEVSFGAAAGIGGGSAATPGMGGTISRAVQSGGVSLSHLPGRRAGEVAAPVLTRATGAEAVFEEQGKTLTVSGEVRGGQARGGQAQVTQGDTLLRADTVTLQQETGDATAVGRVAVSYRQAPTAEPVHVAAARGEFKHDAGNGIFYGGGGSPARMWQGGSQVEAAVIEFGQAEKTLTARAGEGAGLQVVRTVLAGVAKAGAERGGAGHPQVMRIASRTLHYSEADRRAQFGGGVVVEDADGTVRAAEVVALLLKAQAGADGTAKEGAAKQTGFMGGRVDRVTATGGVDVSEPGRRATGDQLVYTAGDGKFVMTGSPARPPRVLDEVQGTITGTSLEFHAGDNSVMVVGDGKGEKGRRVRTETLVRQP